MRVNLEFEIACTPEVAWRAMHDPRVAAQLYGPVMHMQPVTPLPTAWRTGDQATVRLLVFGRVPVGSQRIAISDHSSHKSEEHTLVMQDSGEPLTGPLSLLKGWNHQMAVSALPGKPGHAVWREQLLIGGPAAPLFWPALWIVWRLRAIRLRLLAPKWEAADPSH